MFPLVAEFFDRAPECTKKATMTVVHSEYWAIFRLVVNLKKFNGIKTVDLIRITDKVAVPNVLDVRTI